MSWGPGGEGQRPVTQQHGGFMGQAGPLTPQGTHSKCIFKFPVFPVQPQIFPVPNYVICDYYIHKTDLADLSSLIFWGEIYAANIEISFTFIILELTT